MSKADTDHGGPSGDGLMAGLNIKSGIPNVVPGSNEEDTIDDVGSGTLTGLATRNSEGVLTGYAQAF